MRVVREKIYVTRRQSHLHQLCLVYRSQTWALEILVYAN
jgi:hypothetical protein